MSSLVPQGELHGIVSRFVLRMVGGGVGAFLHRFSLSPREGMFNNNEELGRRQVAEDATEIMELLLSH